MKNAKTVENLKTFVKKALKEGKGAEVTQMDPLRALVRGILSYDLAGGGGEGRVDEAFVVIDREFCDLNELRVATELELQDMLGVKYPDIERRAVRIVAILNTVFEKEGTLSFERIKALGKKEIRQFLREMPEMTPYIEAYTMLYGFDSAAVPVDGELLELLVENEAAEEGTTVEEAQKAIENQLKADEIPEFHAGNRKLLAGKKKK
jgi:endonuclease III